jgi:hypothetical protein
MKEAPKWPDVSKAEPIHPAPGYSPAAAAPGCVCPPGANLTCENPACPRKGGGGAAKGWGEGDLVMKGGR